MGITDEQNTTDRLDQMMAALRSRYGDRLDERQLEEVQEAAKAIVQASDDMRAVRLEHGDSPFSLPPYRND